MTWQWSKTGEELVWVDPNPAEKTRVLNLIDQLEDSRQGTHAKNMADRLRAAVNDGRMPLEVLKKASRWCNTAGSFAKSLPIAQSLAQALFDRGLPRLVSESGGPVADYTQEIEALKEEWGEVEADDDDAQRNAPDAALAAEPCI
jgi:hypothetical protein